MATEAERRMVMAHLERRETIVEDTAAALAAEKKTEAGPLDGVDPEFFAKVEEEYYAERGRLKYVSRNGRIRWLTPEEIETRRKTRRKNKESSRYYGPTADTDRRELTRKLFNVGAVLLALLIVFFVVL